MSGVRQGCLLAPLLFNLVLEWVVRQVRRDDSGVKIGRLGISELAYADDVVILAEDMQFLDMAFRDFCRAAAKIGLQVNESKTKLMHVQRGVAFQEGQEIVGDLNIERVNCFTYLGSKLAPNNDIDLEVSTRISAATRAFYGLRQLFCTRLLSRRTKLRLYSTMIRPVLTYGAETWSVTQTIEAKILRFENNTLKTICGPIFDVELGRWRRRYAREVRQLTALPLVTDHIRSSRIRWLGHILRSGPERTTYNVFNEIMAGRRPRGRPRTRWKDVLMADLRLLDIDPENIEELAEDRRGWRRFVVAAKGLNRPNAPGE